MTPREGSGELNLGVSRRPAIRWALFGAWMLVIFLFSAQPADDSSALSGAVMQAVVSVLDWGARLFGVDGFPAGALEVLHLVVRKAAHVVLYAVLGALALVALAPRRADAGAGAEAREADTRAGTGSAVVGWRPAAGAFLISVAYAVSDEVHQSFVQGRGGAATDVLIDAAGAALGILAVVRWWAVPLLTPRRPPSHA